MRAAALIAALFVSGCGSAPEGPVTETGALEAGDLSLASGELYDSYPLTAREGQWITVTVTTDRFDPYLILRSPSQEQSEIDDSQSDPTTTRMSVRAGESGRWEALVTSFAPGETGAYTVTYHVTDAAPPDAVTPDTAPGSGETLTV